MKELYEQTPDLTPVITPDRTPIRSKEVSVTESSISGLGS
jgi:hypothetical protein